MSALARSALRTAAPVLAALLLGGCLGLHPRAPEVTGAPTFRPDAFFDGASEGVGTLRLRIGRTELLRVESQGAYDADSTFRLVQTIRRDDGAPSQRSWTMRRVAPGRYTGTLTDATGPVRVEVAGNELRIAYAMGRFTRMQQRLVLLPDGRTAVNLSTVTLLGLPVARLFETIHRATPLPGAR